MKKCNWNFPRPELDNRFGHQINSNSRVAIPSFSFQTTLLTEVGCFCRLFRKPATPNDRAIAFHSSTVPPLLTRSNPENVSSVLKDFPPVYSKSLPSTATDTFCMISSLYWTYTEVFCGVGKKQNVVWILRTDRTIRWEDVRINRRGKMHLLYGSIYLGVEMMK